MSFCKVCKPSVPNLPISCLILSCIENPGEGIFVGRLAEESKARRRFSSGSSFLRLGPAARLSGR